MRAMVDLQAATDFLTTHARVLDRRRLELLLGGGDAAGVRAALDAYRNADGGFGWGLEPDLRVPGSQPAGALHAFETLAETGGGEETARALCDWLDTVSLPDGGLPFALPDASPAGFARAVARRRSGGLLAPHDRGRVRAGAPGARARQGIPGWSGRPRFAWPRSARRTSRAARTS